MNSSNCSKRKNWTSKECGVATPWIKTQLLLWSTHVKLQDAPVPEPSFGERAWRVPFRTISGVHTVSLEGNQPRHSDLKPSSRGANQRWPGVGWLWWACYLEATERKFLAWLDDGGDRSKQILTGRKCDCSGKMQRVDLSNSGYVMKNGKESPLAMSAQLIVTVSLSMVPHFKHSCACLGLGAKSVLCDLASLGVAD